VYSEIVITRETLEEAVRKGIVQDPRLVREREDGRIGLLVLEDDRERMDRAILAAPADMGLTHDRLLRAILESIP
jgi:hypothetical protein